MKEGAMKLTGVIIIACLAAMVISACSPRVNNENEYKQHT